MKLLEEELGCVLFERGARKIRLTEAGRLLYKTPGCPPQPGCSCSF